MDKQLRDILNGMARIEAKLDAILGKDKLDKLELPTPMKMSSMPYEIRVSPEDSTSDVPVSEASASPAPDMERPVLEHLNTTESPVVPAAAPAEPVEGYAKMTEGEAIKVAKGVTDPTEQQKFLQYEKASKNRERVLEAIVVTPSESSAPPPSTPPAPPASPKSTDKAPAAA